MDRKIGLSSRRVKSILPPCVPMHGIACMLQQVRTCFHSQPVGHLVFLLVALKVTPDVFEFYGQAGLIPRSRVGSVYSITLNQLVDAAVESIPSSSARSLPQITPIVRSGVSTLNVDTA